VFIILLGLILTLFFVIASHGKILSIIFGAKKITNGIGLFLMMIVGAVFDF
jgi:hypothetical protein